VARQYFTRGLVEEPFVASEIALIKAHSTTNQQCLILSQRQGIYYAETGTGSPMRGPGLAEMLLKSDEQRLRDRLLKASFSCVFVGIGDFSDPGLKIDMPSVSQVYDEAARNHEGTMLFLRSKAKSCDPCD
jgi:hypothetical protein